MSLVERIQQVEQRVQDACVRSGRERQDVHIIAVTKYVSLESTKRVLEHSLLHIGENRWQDAQNKWERLGQKGTWHFIGHLQTNKVKEVVGRFTNIHSLDRPALAREIEKKASSLGIQVRCFIQVNVSGEETKYGLPPEQLFSFAEQLREYKHIHIVGLMAMAPFESKAEETRPVFKGLRLLRDQLNDKAIFEHQVTELSMGMSNDFEVAIEEGATWIRLGSVLVGKE